MKAKEEGNKGGDPVRSPPEVTDVELNRVGEAMEEMICGVWFPTAAFRASWINGRVESVLVDGLFKTLNEVGIRLFCGIWEGSLPLGPH